MTVRCEKSGLLMTLGCSSSHCFPLLDTHIYNHSHLYAPGDLVWASLPSFCSPFLWVFIETVIWTNLNRAAGAADISGCFREKRLQDYTQLSLRRQHTVRWYIRQALSAFTFSIATRMFSSKYDQLLMGGTSMKEAVRVHFFHRCMTRETLYEHEMQVCVCVCA